MPGFPVHSPREGGTLQAHLCPPSRPFLSSGAHQRNYKGKTKERTKETVTFLYFSSLSLRTRSSHSDASLLASPSVRAGTSLPTSVVERKPNTAWLHLLSAKSSRSVNRLFHLPVSFPTSAHKIFCWAFHSGHTAKMCPASAPYMSTTSTERWVSSIQFRYCLAR